MPGTPETIIAFDFGRRRIGVAVGQQVTSSASPLAVIANGRNGPDWQKIESLVIDWRPDRLIVGMPTHADGSRSEFGDVVDAFIDELARFELPIEAVDERYTSLEAADILKSQRANGLRGRVSKEMIDSGAAILIAERWLKKEHQ
jgi:putative Holliday junction resolvase